jgi:hypothetical protein
VFETLRGITKLALSHIKIHVLGESHAVAAAPNLPLAPTPPPAPNPPPQEIEALTLSDLPSVTDLLDMEDSIAPKSMEGYKPLTDDDDDSGLFIEAPFLPEPPEEAKESIGWALGSEHAQPSAAPAAGDPLGSTLTEAGRVLAEDFLQASPGAIPPLMAGREAEPLPAPELAGEPNQAQPGPVPGLDGDLAPSDLAVEPVSPPSKQTQRTDPLAALGSLKVGTKRLTAKPKAVDHRVAIESLLGELTQASRSGQASMLRMEVPPEVEGHEIEVVVQLRRQGQVIAEGMSHHPLPGKGSTSKLTVEFKRS